MSDSTRGKRLVVASALLAVGAALLPALPASAAVGSIACNSSVETINNGTYFSATQNINRQCGSVANGAFVNINGQILWTAPVSWSSAGGTHSRSYAGVVQRSRHYHNGTYNTLYA